MQVEASDEVVALLDDLLYRLWRELATHFHVPTLQWAGPYSRSYSSLLRKYGVRTNHFRSPCSANSTTSSLSFALPIAADLKRMFSCSWPSGTSCP